MRLYDLLEDILLYTEQEQEDPPEEQEAPDEEAQAEPPAEEYEEEPAAGGDEFGEPEVSPEETITIIDKAYRLKKIYSRLIALSRILDYETDPKLEEIRDKTLEAIDLFHIIVSNFDSFKDKLDNIIDGFYKFLEKATEELDKLTKETKEE